MAQPRAAARRLLIVRAVDPRYRRDAYGAQLIVHAGGRRWLRSIGPGFSYQSSSDPRAHFGLGDADRVDRVVVRWPDGRVEHFEPDTIDAALTLVRGEGATDP